MNYTLKKKNRSWRPCLGGNNPAAQEDIAIWLPRIIAEILKHFPSQRSLFSAQEQSLEQNAEYLTGAATNV
jgi:hypothetical protein